MANDPRSNLVAFIALAVATMGAIGWWLSLPRTFEDCVLRNVPATAQESAAGLLTAACRAKFPEPSSRGSDLPSEVLAALRGRVKDGNAYTPGDVHLELYNGSSEWTVTEVTVTLFSPATPPARPPETYRVAVGRLAPLTMKSAYFDVAWPNSQPYNWSLDSARGHSSASIASANSMDVRDSFSTHHLSAMLHAMAFVLAPVVIIWGTIIVVLRRAGVRTAASTLPLLISFSLAWLTSAVLFKLHVGGELRLLASALVGGVMSILTVWIIGDLVRRIDGDQGTTGNP